MKKNAMLLYLLENDKLQLSQRPFDLTCGLYDIDFTILTLLLVIYKKTFLDLSLANNLALLDHIH